MNQYEYMRIFRQVVESGSFSAAAAALHISPAKVSVHIARLEKLLKARLVDRSTRAIRVTDEGAFYYEHCVKILAEIEEMNDRMAGFTQRPAGSIRVEVASLLTNQLLLPVLHEFFEEYPDISLELVHSSHLLDLGHEACDLMIRAGPVSDSSLIGLSIGVARTVTAASPGYLARHGEPQSLEELEHHNCLQMMDPHSGRILEWRFQRDGECVDIQTRGNLTFNEGEAKLNAALLGYGIYHGLEFLIRRHIESGELKPILEDYQEIPARPILVAYPGSEFQPAKLRAFIEFLRKKFPAGSVR